MSISPSPEPGPPSPSISVTSPADILSYIPHALGFAPVESLVVLTTAGKRLGATLRVDLPSRGSDHLAFAEGLLSFLRGDSEADAVLLVVYTAEEWQQPAAPPSNALVLVVEAVLGAAGLPVRGGWLVSDSVWRDYFCTDAQCCPWPGRPLDAVVHSSLNAELIFGGSAFDASAVDAVLRTAPGVAGMRAATGGALRLIEDAQAHYAACCSGRWESPAQFRATSSLWDAVLKNPVAFDEVAEPEVAGFLLASVESRTIRDFLLVSACLGSAAAVEGAASCRVLGAGGGPCGHDEAGVPVLPEVRGDALLRDAATAATTATTQRPDPTAAVRYADVLSGRYPGPIAWSRVDRMTSVLARLASVSAGESRAAALTMSGWFEYARGRGSRAAVFLDAAEAAVPGYRLARLLHELLCRGGLPVWALSRSTAWTAGAAALPSRVS